MQLHTTGTVLSLRGKAARAAVPYRHNLAGSIPRLHHRRCSRQGNIVCGYCGVEPHPFGLRTRSIRILHHWRMFPETRGNGRYCGEGRVETKYPRATPLAIAGKLLDLSRLSGISRGMARRYNLAVASSIHDEPTSLSSLGCIVRPNWKMIVITASPAGLTLTQVIEKIQVEIQRIFICNDFRYE